MSEFMPITPEDEALAFLAPRHKVASFTDEIDAQTELEQQQQLDARTQSLMATLPASAPADYDYRAALAAGNSIKPNTDGSLDLPIPGMRRLQVAGHDVVTGKQYLSGFEHPSVKQGVSMLQQHKLNTATNAGDDTLPALTRIAHGIDDPETFDKATAFWTRQQKLTAWRAAENTRIREAYERGDIDLEALPPAPVPSFQVTEEQLAETPGWLADAKAIQEYLDGEPWPGSDDELHEAQLSRLARLNSPAWGGALLVRTYSAPDEVKQAFYRAYTVYQATPDSLDQFGRAVAYNVADPTNYAGFGAGAAVGKLSAKAAAAGLARAAQAALRGAVGGAAWASLDDIYSQAPAIQADQATYDPEQTAEAAAMGAVIGGELGGVLK